MATSTLLTFEDFERLPDEPGKQELLDGELITLPPSKIRNMEISHLLQDILKSFLEQTGTALQLGRVFVEVGYKIGPRNWLQPDVSVEHPRQPRGDYLEGAPALAIEVISESNSAEHVEFKRQTYLANGAIEVWVFYPKTRCAWVFRQGHAREFCDVLTSDLIPGLRIDLGALFA